MELCKEYNTLSCNEKSESISEGFDIDYQLNLPQYLDDIDRVIKYSIRNVLCDYELEGRSIRLYCKSIISLSYLNADGCPFSNIFEEEFTRSIDINDTERFCFSNVRICTRYSNFKLINQRRIDVHSSLSARLDVFALNTSRVLSGCDGAFTRGLEKKALINKITSYTALEFDEQFDILNKKALIRNIVNTFVSCDVDEVKIIKDKMLVKLSGCVSLVYYSEDNNYERCQYSFTLSKIVDACDCDENDISFISTNISELYVKTKADENNALSIFEIIGRLVINYRIFRVENISLVDDAYVPGCITQQNKSTLSINAEPAYFNDEKAIDACIDFETPIVEIIDLKADIANVNIESSELVFDAVISTLYYDDESRINYIEKSQRCSIPLAEYPCCGEGNAVLRSFDYSISGATGLNVRLSVSYQAFLYHNEEISFISDIDADESDVSDNPSELTLYFARKDESIWSIAKKFSTDMNLIINENNLKGDTVEESRVLFVLGM